MENFIDIFIPSYHRSDNLKTVKYFLKIGWSPKHIHVFVDDETDDIDDYRSVCDGYGVNLHVFSMDEARARYDYIHRPSESRRSAGQARNMFYDIAKKLKISFYMVQDDDTQNYEIKKFGKYKGKAPAEDVKNFFEAVRDFMLKRKIGCFGISQTGDFIGGSNSKILRNKVMNTTFINTEYMYRGERAVQDNDTSQFVGIMNEGFFTGSVADGLVLQQTTSAKAKGGLTDLYNECKLLNKSLVIPIQFPSVSFASKQEKNGGRLHHNITNKNLAPRLIKGTPERDNIAWNKYPEDERFSNEPLRAKMK
jgi:TET-Associated Glycosyltransferase